MPLPHLLLSGQSFGGQFAGLSGRLGGQMGTAIAYNRLSDGDDRDLELQVLRGLGDPLQITTFSMALNALLAPVIVFPLLILMNDRHYVREYRNHVVGNVFVSAIVVIAFIIAAVAIPLEMLGG